MILNLRSRGDLSDGILPWMVEVWIDGYEFDDGDDMTVKGCLYGTPENETSDQWQGV